MRCAAHVEERSITGRKWPGEDENFLSLERQRQQARRCRREGKVKLWTPFGPRLFCLQHLPIYRKHYQLVNEILQIPVCRK